MREVLKSHVLVAPKVIKEPCLALRYSRGLQRLRWDFLSPNAPRIVMARLHLGGGLLTALVSSYHPPTFLLGQVPAPCHFLTMRPGMST